MNRKRRLASSALWPMGDNADDTNELQREVIRNASTKTDGEPVEAAMRAMFERDGKPMPDIAGDQSLVFE